MATTVKENLTIFALFVCFVALRPSQPILQRRDNTSNLCDFIQHWDAMTSKRYLNYNH